MATLRERVRAWRRADELDEQLTTLTESLTLAVNAVSSQGFTTPQELAEQLREYDQQYLDLLIDNLLYDQIGTAGSQAATDKERQNAVDASRQAWRASPLAQWGIWTWTAWGLGDGVQVATEDESAQEDWDEFIEADRNAAVFGADNLHALSERVLVDGNVFLSVFAAREDGLATVRPISQDEIDDNILTKPGDKAVPWFYKREFTQGQHIRTLYYPDWALFFSGGVEEAWETLVTQNVVSQHDADKRADLQQNGEVSLLKESGTAVCMLHIAHNIKSFDGLWGWPLTTVAGPWLRAHKRHLQARLTIVMSLAQFVRQSRVAGGSRAVESIRSQIASTLSRNNYTETNPPGVPGSWRVENQAMETTEIEPRTGGADAKQNNDMFSWMAGLGIGLNTVTMGLDTNRFATSMVMDKVQSYLFSRYKTFWSTQFRRMVRIVLSFLELYGSKSYSTHEAQVSIDSFSLPDFPDIVNSESALMRELTSAANAGILSSDGVAAIDARMIATALQALGVQDVADLTSDEALIPEEAEEPEQTPMMPPQMVPEEPEVLEAVEIARALAEMVIADAVERRNDEQ